MAYDMPWARDWHGTTMLCLMATLLTPKTRTLRVLVVLFASSVAGCGGGRALGLINANVSATAAIGTSQNGDAERPTTQPSFAVPTPVPTEAASPLPSDTPMPSPTAGVTPTPIPTPTQSTAANPNINGIPYNPNALTSFDPNTLDNEAGQYPSCLTCSSMGFTTVAACPVNGIGTSLPCESYCHINVGDIANDYTTNPPASGNHYPSPEYQTGEHISPVARGSWIHSMEHGAIILAYNCPQGCADTLAIFRQALVARPGHKIIMTPDPLLANPIAMISWTWLDLSPTPTLADVLCFIDQHENNAREDLPLDSMQ